jgi:hypothetical protein
MFSSCRAARLFTKDETTTSIIAIHSNVQRNSLSNACNPHHLNQFDIYENHKINHLECWFALLTEKACGAALFVVHANSNGRFATSITIMTNPNPSAGPKQRIRSWKTSPFL